MKRLTGFFNMKKLVLGALACAALVLMMPGEAKAAQHERNTPLLLYLSTENEGNLETQGYKWEKGDGSTWNKLTLKDIKIDIPDNSSKAIGVQGNTEIVLEGENEIELTNSSSDGYGGIYIYGDLKITGNGKLTIKVNITSGIHAVRNVTIDGVTIKIEDTAVHGRSKIHSNKGNITIKNSNVTINGKSNDTHISGNGLDTGSMGNILIDNSELYIKIEGDGDCHCFQPKGDNLASTFVIKDNDNLKVTYVKGGVPYTIEKSIVGKESELCNSGTKEVTITYKESTNSGSPSDKKNESSPFHKFETDSIKEAKASGKIDATGGWKSFDRGTLNELAKLGKDISVTYDFNGHTYRVVVPKGFDPQKLVNEEGYCGFLYLAKVYGAVMIK